MNRKSLILVIIMLCIALPAVFAIPVAPKVADAVTKTYEERGYFVYSNTKQALPADIYTIFYCIDGTCQENLPPCTVLEFKEPADTASKRYDVYIAYGENKVVIANQLFTNGIYIVEHELKKAQYLVLKKAGTAADATDEIVIMLADQN